MLTKLRWMLLSIILFFSANLLAQETVSGTVLDENGGPMPGVTVLIKGTTTGVSTNMDGVFTMPKLEDGTYQFVFSFIGYKSDTIQVDVKGGKAAAPIKISLEVNAQTLDEMVIVGYGVQRKRELTGSIAKVDGKNLTAVPVPSFESGLQGQAAGVQVTTGSGLAGSPALIRIRGVGSVSAGGDPLYVVDGIPITQDYFLRSNSGGMNTNPLAAINPNDIESVEVLKDAAATGIYGSRGANGVILITTKRGNTKGLTIDFNARWGLAQPTARPKMLDGDEYLQMYQEAWENDGNTGRASLPNVSWETAEDYNTDWVDQTVGNGFKQLYSLGVNTKKDKWGLFGNFTYDDNQSYLIGNSYERMSGRMNFDYYISDKLNLSVNTSFSQGLNRRVDAAWSGGLGAAMSTALPIYPVRWDSLQVANPVTGEFNIDPATGDTIPYARQGDYWREAGAGNNPVAMREWKEWRTQELRTINNLRLNYMPIDNLIITATLGYDFMRINDDRWESEDLLQDGTIGSGVAYRDQVGVNNSNGSLLANYNWRPTDKHDFRFLMGTEYQYSQTKSTYESFSHIDGPLYNHESDSVRDEPSGNPVDEWGFVSLFGRVNYMWQGKYIAQVTSRVDGSSKFGDNNKFGYFPSASLGWIMSEEDFMKGQNLFSFFKWKVSAGRTGNANLPTYKDFEKYSPPENNSTYNGEPILYKIELENPDLSWETSTNWDIAAEMGLLNDRITMEAAYYRKYASDVLMRVQLPQSLGYGEYWDNVGEILNRGWELSISSRNMVGELQWTTNFNIARNYNEVKSIGVYTEDAILGGTNDTRIVVGSPVGSNFLVRYAGVDPDNGRPTYYTKEGDVTYDWNPNDRVVVGDILPDFIGGFNNFWSYKNWDLALDMVYSIGAKIYDSSSKRQLGVTTDWNMRTEVFERWRKEGDITDAPVRTLDTETYGSGTPWINTDQWLKDGDYLRFRRLALGYTFTPEALGKNINNFRVEASMTNFLTWTNFEGLDPEIARDFENAADRNMSGNVTYLTPPQEKTYNLAISMSF